MAVPRPRFELCLVTGACSVAALIAWSTPTSEDYWPGGQVLGDGNSAPAIDALAHGHFGAFVTNQPVMGLVSLAAWLSRQNSERSSKAICALTCVVLIVGPSNVSAVSAGHPEEMLTAVLAVCAGIAAAPSGWCGRWPIPIRTTAIAFPS